MRQQAVAKTRHDTETPNQESREEGASRATPGRRRQVRGAARGKGRATGVVVLYSAAEQGRPDPSRDSLADLETVAVAQAVADILHRYTDLRVHLLPAASHVERKLSPYPPDDYVVFNLFEGLDDPNGERDADWADEEARAALALQELGYRFTGCRAGALALAVNKARTKELLQQAGVLTPQWQVFSSQDELTSAGLGGLAFPLIVKPVAEDSSLAIDQGAVVDDLPDLQARVRYVTQSYHQPALVEDFIDGREFNASIWGSPPEILPLAEIQLEALGAATRRIASFAAKWEEGSFEYSHTPVTCPAVVGDELAERIRSMALRAWRVITGDCGYGRVDMRERGGQPYVLEVNPNPSIAADAGFARSARAAGLDYAQMILKILSFAMEELHVDNPSRR